MLIRAIFNLSTDVKNTEKLNTKLALKALGLYHLAMARCEFKIIRRDP